MTNKPRVFKSWQHGWVVEFRDAEYKSYMVGCITWSCAVHTALEILRVRARQKAEVKPRA